MAKNYFLIDQHTFITWRVCYSVDNVMSLKSYMYDHTCKNTLARMRNVIDNVRVNNAFSHFEGDKIPF